MDTDEEIRSLVNELRACRGDPELFVDTMFDWNHPELVGKSPEKWQRKVLRGIKEELLLARSGLPVQQGTALARRPLLAGSSSGRCRPAAILGAF
jgi:hypothetical protein